jgi:choline oxidase
VSDATTASYDVVIVGGGTAGSVLARRLADRGDTTVALLEAGPVDEGLDRVLQVARWMELLEGDLDYDYTIEPQERGNGRIRHSRARVLGGCSSHNSCIAFRTPDRDLREWEALGATGWGPEGFGPSLDRVFATVHIHEPPEVNPLHEAVIAACGQYGLPPIRFNQGRFEAGAARFQLNVEDGIRQSSSVAYLHPLAALPDTLDLITETKVARVLTEGDGATVRATGVRTTDGRTIRAHREVVLCAGAFDTPKLLQLSGIGPADHLRGHGIEVVRDLPGVGEHLLDHPEGVVNYELTAPLSGPVSQHWEVGIFAHVEDTGHPDLMFHLGLVPFTMQTEGAGYPTTEHGFALTPNVCRSRSEGTVRLRSADPADAPAIDFRYFTDPDGYDERIMVAGLEMAREIAAQPALATHVARELTPGPDVTDRAAMSEYVRTTANTVYHPAGTCRMGSPDAVTTVVDPELRVLGVDGLRVADASIFPSMPSVNPGITCFAIGERAADLLSSGS